jgi:hypothetical protein
MALIRNKSLQLEYAQYHYLWNIIKTTLIISGNTEVYFESPLGRNEIIIDIWVEHMNKISFGENIFICNDIISEIVGNFQIVVEECIV